MGAVGIIEYVRNSIFRMIVISVRGGDGEHIPDEWILHPGVINHELEPDAQPPQVGSKPKSRPSSEQHRTRLRYLPTVRG